MFCETRNINPKKAFRVIGFVIYTIIDDYVCTDYLACPTTTKIQWVINIQRNILTEYWVLEFPFCSCTYCLVIVFE